MKLMKKLASLALALVIVLAMGTPALAAEITVTNAKEGETYTAYKIFNVTYSGTNYAYTMDADSPWKEAITAYTYNSEKVFTLSPSANDEDVLVVNVSDAFSSLTDAADLADYLSNHIPTTAVSTSVTADSNDVAKFTDLATGYYFVDTTLGSLCSLFTTDDGAILQEKNTIPSLNKTENKDTLAVGDTVTYTITVTDSKGTDQAITVHDQMEAGLTLIAGTFELKDKDGETISTDDYTINTSGLTDDCTFEIVFTADCVKRMQEGDQIIITYTATLNENVEIHTRTNDNTAWLEYSDHITTEITVKVSSFKFDLDKTDASGKALTGATFKLYDAETGGNEVAVVKVSDGHYRVAEEDESSVIIETGSDGRATVEGLDAKAYWLEEISAPNGYNPLTSRQKVDLSDKINLVRTEENGSVITYGVQVINNTGTELPSTGGVGTTIFYIVGGVLVLAAVVLLVTRKRMNREG